MSLSLIVAMDSKNGIGINNQIPWVLKEDLKWFKTNTLHKTVVMGSNTYYSLPPKHRPLTERRNIVLTKDQSKYDFITISGAEIMSIEDVIELSKNEDVFIIGGGSIYNQFIDLCDTLYITQIEADFNCNIMFPIINYDNYNAIYSSSNKSDCAEIYKYTFNIYKKK